MDADWIRQGDSRSRRKFPRAWGWARCTALAGAWLTMAALLGLAACDDLDPVDPPPPPPPPPGPFVLSDPGAGTPSAVAAGISRAAGVGTQTDLVYVSLPTGEVDEGRLATITNRTTGATARTAMADGGFDPVPLPAHAGDAVAVEIQLSGSTALMQLSYVVPIRRRPIVIRMDPPPRKRDIVLNAPIRIVFSEPVTDVDGGSMRLLRNGVPVSGQVTLSADGLRAQFQPDQLLAPNADYVLSVATDVADLSGDSLETALEAGFTTGATTAVAAAYTDPAALYVVTSYAPLNGLLRTAEFEAILHDDGRVTGQYSLFYQERGWTNSGSISCFSIAGDSVWIGGVTEEATKTDQIGKHVAWFAVDNAYRGVPDQLSLAWVGLPSGAIGTVQDHCDEHPTELEVQNVESGDVVVTGTTPPPPPRPSAAHLLITRQPEDAIVGRPIGRGVYVRALDATRTRTGSFTGSVAKIGRAHV